MTETRRCVRKKLGRSPDVYFQEARLGALTGQLRLSNSVHLDL